VRKLATLLRIADSLDRSHQQPIKALKASKTRDGVSLQLRAQKAVDLELWNADREIANFRSVYGQRLSFHVSR
jgi:exopolyphosphatase/guanosine-5'-triphosphate,3'-diphosphate pyrophosphatase